MRKSKLIAQQTSVLKQQMEKIDELQDIIIALEAKLQKKLLVDTADWKEAHKQDRLEAADEFVWFLVIMMGCGSFEDMSLDTPQGKETRAWIGKELQPWLDNAYAPWEDEDASL